jgi:hypothetical protein
LSLTKDIRRGLWEKLSCHVLKNGAISCLVGLEPTALGYMPSTSTPLADRLPRIYRSFQKVLRKDSVNKRKNKRHNMHTEETC